MAVTKTILKRYSGTIWDELYLKTSSDIVYRANGTTTLESDLTNYLPEATGSTGAPASNTLGKLKIDNDGNVYTASSAGEVLKLKIDDGSGAGVNYIQSESQPAADAQVEGDFWECPLA